MPDREKVIKGLKCHTEMNCVECPYRDGWRTCPFGETLLADALALLEEQKAVEPKKVNGYNPPMYTIYEYECEKCKSPMMNKQPFCMGCGRSVKWE